MHSTATANSRVEVLIQINSNYIHIHKQLHQSSKGYIMHARDTCKALKKQILERPTSRDTNYKFLFKNNHKLIQIFPCRETRHLKQCTTQKCLMIRNLASSCCKQLEVYPMMWTGHK